MAKGSKEIRKRIRSVKNTQQVTKAMKMVAASRLRKSEGRTQASRPYSDTLREVMGSLAGVAGDVDHPYLKHIAPEEKKIMVLHVASQQRANGSLEPESCEQRRDRDRLVCSQYCAGRYL